MSYEILSFSESSLDLSIIIPVYLILYRVFSNNTSFYQYFVSEIIVPMCELYYNSLVSYVLVHLFSNSLYFLIF